jgi:hypothetical protein
MYIFIIQYILLTVISFLSSLSKRYERVLLAFLGIGLFLFAGLRGAGVDRDYFVYARFFDNITGSNVNYFSVERFTFYEPAFYFIPYISKLLAGTQYLPLTFIIFAAIGVYLKFRTFYLSNSVFLSLLVYSSYYFYIHEMTQIRVGISTALLLLSLRHVLTREPGKFFMLVVGAMFFHYTSALFLPVYFFNHKGINKWLIFSLIAFAYVFAILRIDFVSATGLTDLSPKLALYNASVKLGEDKNRINIFNFWFVLDAVVTICLTLRYKVILDHNPYLPLLLKISTVGLMCYLLLSSLPVVAGRMYELFGVVQFVLYPCLIYAFPQKIIGYLFCIGVSAMHFAYLIWIMRLFEHGYYSWIF